MTKLPPLATNPPPPAVGTTPGISEYHCRCVFHLTVDPPHAGGAGALRGVEGGEDGAVSERQRRLHHVPVGAGG
eukprot:8220116-Pyramimonas_sp.AAC.1